MPSYFERILHAGLPRLLREYLFEATDVGRFDAGVVGQLIDGDAPNHVSVERELPASHRRRAIFRADGAVVRGYRPPLELQTLPEAGCAEAERKGQAISAGLIVPGTT